VANNILPVIKTYRHMVREAHKPTNARSLPDGYRTVRVQRTLDDLHDQLDELSRLAEAVTQQVPAPIEEPEFAVSSITPSVVAFKDLTTTEFVVTGVGFQQAATLSLGNLAANVTPVSDRVLVATLGSRPQNAPSVPTTYPVSVTNVADGETTAPLQPGLVVLP
jgi:hypothetical protein